jgi:putative ABC transport system permease protein
MSVVVSSSMAERRFYMQLLGMFATLAFVLAAVGIYGVVSYSVAQRTREIGIRLALGAQRSDVLRLVLKEALRLTVLGVGLGLAGAYAATRVLRSLLFEVKATDPATFIFLSLLLTLIALIASYIPGRAMKVDPLVALRYECRDATDETVASPYVRLRRALCSNQLLCVIEVRQAETDKVFVVCESVILQ